jgi:hypothetical protein
MADSLGGARIGAIRPTARREGPGNGWIVADGRSISRTVDPSGWPTGSAAALFDIICPIVGTATTTAGGTSITWSPALSFYLQPGERIIFVNPGAAFTADPTVYYVRTVGAGGAITVTTVAPTATQTLTQWNNASGAVAAGAAVSGITVRLVPHGVDDANSFNIPDLRTRIPVGRDNMGSNGLASRLSQHLSGLGVSHGSDKWQLLSDEMGERSHSHGGATAGHGNTGVNPAVATPNANTGSVTVATGAGGNHAHGNWSGSTNGESHNHYHNIQYSNQPVSTGNQVYLWEPFNNSSSYQATGAPLHNHYHTASTSSGNQSLNHSHNLTVPSMNLGPHQVGPLTINSEAAHAKEAHPNLPPFLVANRLIRVY